MQRNALATQRGLCDQLAQGGFCHAMVLAEYRLNLVHPLHLEKNQPRGLPHTTNGAPQSTISCCANAKTLITGKTAPGQKPGINRSNQPAHSSKDVREHLRHKNSEPQLLAAESYITLYLDPPPRQGVEGPDTLTRVKAL